MNKKQLTVGGHCFIRRPETSFSGTVFELRTDWARVIGKGSIVDTHFNEWFPIKSKCCNVEPAS
jgi:hypothetical protein